MPRSPEAARPLAVRIVRRLPYAIPAADWFHAWRREHERSARNLTRKNTLRAYNRVYGSDRWLAEYLGPERLKFYEQVAERCAPLAPRRVIDVGCGTGHLLRFLVDRLPANPELVVGIDHSPAGIQRARAQLPAGHWLVGDLYRLPPEEDRFDLVLCTEVLEHVREPARAVEILCGLCAPGGRVAITVPDGAEDSWPGHVNFWDEDELRAFLAPHGLVGIDRIQGGAVLLAWLAPEQETAIRPESIAQ